MYIQKNINEILAQIAQCATKYGRAPQEINLIAVSKKHSNAAIMAAINCGLRQFGENYSQEGVAKICYFRNTLPLGHPPLIWHFIGPIQSNKTKIIAQYFDWVQSIERLKIAERLSEQRPLSLPPLQVLIQVNISEEESKSGIPYADVFSLAAAISHLPNLQLRGLMAIPARQNDPSIHLQHLTKMRDIFLELAQLYPNVDTLSMGMSEDKCTAIQAGSTMVRIGTALFGTRTT